LVKMFNKIVIFFLGACIGLLGFFSPGALFLLIAVGFTCLALRHYTHGRQRVFLISVFLIAFCIRLIVSLTLDLSALAIFPSAAMREVKNPIPADDDYQNLIKENTRTFFKIGDSDYSSARGYMYAAAARGMDNKVIRHYLDPTSSYGVNGYLYVIGMFYFLFGYSPITVKFLNCYFGAVAVIFIYLLGRNYNEIAARIACFFMIFFPSLILWSTTDLKDTSTMLASVLLVYSITLIMRKITLSSLLLMIFALLMQFFLTKRDLWFLSLISLFLVFFTGIFFNLSQRQKTRLCVSVILIALPLVSLTHIFDNAVITRMHKLFIHHIGNVHTQGISYRVLDESYYHDPDSIYEMPTQKLITSSIMAVIHFLLEPFPSRFLHKNFIVVWPQMIFWYSLIPSIFLGIILLLRNCMQKSLPVFIYTFLTTCSIAIGSGNVGTVFRHRDYVTQFYLLFAAIGISNCFKAKEGKRENEVVF